MKVQILLTPFGDTDGIARMGLPLPSLPMAAPRRKSTWPPTPVRVINAFSYSSNNMSLIFLPFKKNMESYGKAVKTVRLVTEAVVCKCKLCTSWNCQRDVCSQTSLILTQRGAKNFKLFRFPEVYCTFTAYRTSCFRGAPLSAGSSILFGLVFFFYGARRREAFCAFGCCQFHFFQKSDFWACCCSGPPIVEGQAGESNLLAGVFFLVL